MKLSRAVDLWMGELARAGRQESSRFAYQRYLFKFVDHVERGTPDAVVRDVTTNDCRTFLDKWIDRSPSTVASIHSALNGLFRWLYLEGEIDHNPMTRVARPRRTRPEDLDVVIVKPADVERMLAAAEDWQEFLCLSVLAYTGSGEAPRVGCAGVTSIWSRGRSVFWRRATRRRSSRSPTSWSRS